MRKFLRWLDDNILAILAGFLLIFIPLYPKLPLLDVLPGYIVRVRLEDFLVSATILVWLYYVFRGKTNLSDNPLTKPVLAYLIVGLLSIISAIFILGTVPKEGIHVQKIILHYLRRIEYFSLFFIFYSTIKSIRLVKIYIGILIATVVAVALYGFGQKYLYWPAFSTMNREFAKGWMLYLTEHARVLSTFGGHYDLAAFTMMALIMFWSLFFGVKRWLYKIVIFISIAVTFWALILTASRTSFIAYILGTTLMFFFWTYRKGLRWSMPRWFVVVFLSIVVMLSFGDMSERFTKFLRINERLAGIKSILLSPIGTPPGERAVFLSNNPNEALAMITSKSDQPPKLVRPIDVFQDAPLIIQGKDGSSITTIRTYSKTAFMYDLSTAIRFDALWPQAIDGFKRNILLGSGYATLNKTQPTEFTEAESTDNDYLRSLGETGLLGFITFFGMLVLIIFLIWRYLTLIRDPILFAAVCGLVGLLFGLLVNAGYIDVFESSKVAFSFWAIAGFIVAGLNLVRKERKGKVPLPVIPDLNEVRNKIAIKLTHFIRSDRFFIVLILILAFVLRLYKINTPLADWHSWRQADTSSVTRNYVKHGINILYPTFDDLSNVASGKDNPRGLRFVEFPLYNVATVIVDKIFVGFNVEFSGRLTSIFASLGSIIFLFLLVRKYLGRNEAILASLFYAVLPYNIFYTRVILPEPFLVFTSMGMLYFFDKWVEKIANNQFSIRVLVLFILAYLFTASSLLIKPFAAFLFLPMVYLWFKNLGISIKSTIYLFIYLFICLLPFVWWRWWISHFPEGIPAFMWLLNGDKIRFKGAFFFWLFADRLSRLILGYWGLPLLLLGIISRVKKEGLFFFLWGLSMLLYLTIVATGNIRHDYYQILIIPIICVFMAKGVSFLLQLPEMLVSRILVFCCLFFILLFTEMFGWYHIRDFYNINHPEIVEAGRAVGEKTHNRALVIAPYNGDTAFLYQTNRTGWPIIEESIDKMIEKGAQYYVSVNYDDLTQKLVREATIEDLTKRKYKLIEKNDKYVIIQLVTDRALPR